MVWGLLHALEVRIDAKTAEALYIGLVTDTGRFSYENTTPRAHLMAAELLEAGIDITAIRRRLYEDVRPPSSTCCAMPWTRSSCTAVGALISARITARDFAAAGGTEAHARASSTCSVAFEACGSLRSPASSSTIPAGSRCRSRRRPAHRRLGDRPRQRRGRPPAGGRVHHRPRRRRARGVPVGPARRAGCRRRIAPPSPTRRGRRGTRRDPPHRQARRPQLHGSSLPFAGASGAA